MFSTQLLLQSVPSAVRGRIFATEFALFSLMSAIGSAIMGVALDASLGIPVLLWWMAGLTLIPGTLWTLWQIYRQRAQG